MTNALVLSDLYIVLSGIVIGLLIAVPVGPVNVLCIQRTLHHGFVGGVAAGLGAVVADGILASIAAFGITAITEGMREHVSAIQLGGGIILMGFGVRLLAAKPPLEAPPKPGWGRRLGAGSQTFLLTTTNPGAVLGILAMVGGFAAMAGGLHDYVQAFLLVGAVMTGSLLWWTGLAWLISTIRHRIKLRTLRLLNQFAGVILIGFGVGLLIRFTFGLLAGA